MAWSAGDQDLLLARFLRSAWRSVDDVDAHAARRTRDASGCGVDFVRVHVFQLGLRDLQQLSPGDLAHLVLVRLLGARTRLAHLQTERLLDEDARRRRLHHEREGAVGVDGDDHRNDRVAELLAARVEVLAELHDVHALLTERGPDRRRGIGLAGRDLQLDVTGDFLLGGSHDCSCSTLWFRKGLSGVGCPGGAVRNGPARIAAARKWDCASLALLYVREVQLDRRIAPEDADLDLQLLLVGVHFLDGAREVRERTDHHSDLVALVELVLGLRLDGTFTDAAAETLDARRLDLLGA